MTTTTTMAFTSSTTTNTGSSSSNTIVLFAEKNQPWDVIRFVQQSSKFVGIFPQQGTKSSSSSKKGTIIPGTVLWKAGATTTKENDFEFAPLDDVVMGGASKSNFNTGTGKWKGVVTDANNGGFVGIRSTPIIDYDLSKCNGIEWSILTTNTKDSMRLKVVLRDTTDFNGIGWTTSKDTNKKSSLSSKSKSSTITTFKIPFDNKTLKPSKFAKILTETDIKEPFNTTNIKSFQLTYSKFEYDGTYVRLFEVFVVDSTRLDCAFFQSSMFVHQDPCLLLFYEYHHSYLTCLLSIYFSRFLFASFH